VSRPSARVLRLVAVTYAVKTLLLGVAWMLIPDLPERASTLVRSTFSTPSAP
jgi:hypothetical protein